MKISKLVHVLEQVRKEKGDLDVTISIDGRYNDNESEE